MAKRKFVINDAPPTNWYQAAHKLKQIELEKRQRKAPGLSERFQRIESLIKAIGK